MNYQVEPVKHGIEEVFIRAHAAVARSDNLDMLAEEWLRSPDDRIIFTTGIDDDHQHTLVAVILHSQGQDSAIFYIPLTQIRALYGEFPNLIPSATSIKKFEMGHEQEDKILEARDVKLGAIYDEDLCAQVFSRTHLLELCLGYAVQNIGEAVVQLVEEDFLDSMDIDEHKLGGKKLAMFTAGIRNPENGVGLNEMCYLQWDSADSE